MQNMILPIQSVTSMATAYKDGTKIQLLIFENQISIGKHDRCNQNPKSTLSNGKQTMNP